ncbi:hypothetical protein OOT46_30260 [Aquabacterium sp. A7-Y]|uniref:RHS repeat-associated core domain-containing protein n=1 Tax=Aquabacterium sp. A7-Y TaxID=1349605 RepID=UPI00223DDAE0|nr:RHS repeat-associated core domain-containing protein [Aquabacterium sp. A7-Y]MCW7542082.1 hypothetical protein [Aquabacterium sp. A7-Y]
MSGAGATTTTYTYPATSNRLQSVQQDSQAAQPITTDATGNITVDPANPVGTINYAYTTGEGLVVTGRMNVSYGPMARHVYSHNGLGQRIRKAGSTLTSGTVTYSPPAYVGSSDTYFHYDETGQLIAERDANHLVKREYIWLYDMPVAVITGATPTQPVRMAGTTPNLPQVRYVHTDHLNTPRLITDTTGAKRWEWAVLSEPFGMAAANGSPQGQAAAQRLDFHLRFPGQYFDVETSTAYNYFRAYNSHTGRYAQSDPIGLAGGINTYAYVGGNPVTDVDPDGLSPAAAPTVPRPMPLPIPNIPNPAWILPLLLTGDTSNSDSRRCVCNGQWVYRGDRPSRPPNLVFSGGFRPKGTNLDLLAHARGAPDSGYVATSRSYSIAHAFAGKNGYVYTICIRNGVDVNGVLGNRSPYPEQQEIAVPGGISGSQVMWAASKATSAIEKNPNCECGN